MGSYSSLSYHIVFATKFRRPLISLDIRERFYSYIGGTIRAQSGHLIEIGGVRDHVHILLQLPPVRALATAVRDIKANSSRWFDQNVKQRNYGFQWQKGYAAFTVSYSQISAVQDYVRKQEEHHRKKTFQEEYMELLQRHNLTFQIAHLFEDEHR